jgi:hypothetical protein
MENRDCTGIVWLDEQTKLPLLVTWHITDVPFEEDDTLIRSLQQEDRYRITESGQCLIHTSTTRISAEYSFLFVKKDIEVETTQTYYDHINRQALPKIN